MVTEETIETDLIRQNLATNWPLVIDHRNAQLETLNETVFDRELPASSEVRGFPDIRTRMVCSPSLPAAKTPVSEKVPLFLVRRHAGTSQAKSFDIPMS